MRKIFAISLASILFASCLCAEQKRPNILYIMTDQQSASMMSCAGNKWLNTPAMDSLAANGCTFTRAFSTNPVCQPARVGFVYGVHPGVFGLYENEAKRKIEVPASLMPYAIGNVLKDAGYDCAMVGKRHWLKNMNDNTGLRQLSTQAGRLHDAEKAAEFIKNHDGEKPFFLFVSLINPHDICYMGIIDFNGNTKLDKKALAELNKAMQIPEGASEKGFYANLCPPLPDNHELPKNWQPELNPTRDFRAAIMKNWSAERWRMHRWAYCRLTELVDSEIALVMKALKESGKYDDTVIMFTSDHGDMDAAHKMEHKSVFFEESINVPFIISNPRFAKKGSSSDKLVAFNLDSYPTICDYAGVKPREGLEGRSLRQIAEGKEVKNWRKYVIAEGTNEADLRGLMLRTEDSKYCVYKKDGKHYENFFDLSKNRLESVNEISNPAFASKIAECKKLLKQWCEKEYTLNPNDVLN